MSLCIQIGISNISDGQAKDLTRRVVEQVQGLGFRIDQQNYTPSAEVLSELADVETSRASVKVYES